MTGLREHTSTVAELHGHTRRLPYPTGDEQDGRERHDGALGYSGERENSNNLWRRVLHFASPRRQCVQANKAY